MAKKLEKESKLLDIESFDKTYMTSRRSPGKGEKKYGERTGILEYTVSIMDII